MSTVVSEQDSWRGLGAAARDSPRPALTAVRPARSCLAFAWALPVALLGGLIGLGGAECRLPLLTGPLRHSLHQAVPLNLAVSVVTLAAAIAVRLPAFSLSSLHPFVPVVAALTLGAIVAAPVVASTTGRLTETRLAQSVLGLLLLIGVLLLTSAFLPQPEPVLTPGIMPAQIATGFALGLAVGGVSSLLGVAGGAVLIPLLVVAYGLDVKTAGTASLIISLPIVTIGIARFARVGAYRMDSLRGTVAPMGAGSVLGATIGGLLVGPVPAQVLTGGLGMLIIWSAWRTFAHRRRHGHAATRPLSRNQDSTPPLVPANPMAPPRERHGSRP